MARHTRTPLYALLGANAVSMAGNQITAIAIPWYVLATGGSATQVGLVGFFTFLPTVISAFFGGGIIDRIGRKRISMLADLCSMVAVGLIPLLHSTIGLHFWQLLALVFAGALLDAPGNTARQALFPEIIDQAGMAPERANSAYQTVFRFSQLLGPLVGGVLISALGATNVLWIDAATFAISAAMVLSFVPADAKIEREKSHYVAEMLDGLRFIWKDRVLLWLAGILLVMNFLDAPLYSVAAPLFAKEQFDSAKALGLMFAALGAGGVTGSIGYGFVGQRFSRRTVFVGAFFLCSISPFVLATFPPLGIISAVLFLVGVIGAPLNPILMTVRQERVPIEMRGRVFGAFTALAWLAIPAGMLVGGFMVDALGLRESLIVIGIAYLLVTGPMLWNRSLRGMDRQPEAVESSEHPQPQPLS
jgi:MFS family permease